MNCPTCRSTNVQRTEMVWATQTRTGGFLGAGTDGELVGGATSTSTPLAQKHAPPARPDSALIVLGFGLAVVATGAAGAVGVLSGEISTFLLAAVFAVAGAVAGALGIGQRQRALAAWQPLFDQWRAQWLCLACGAAFTPSAQPGVQARTAAGLTCARCGRRIYPGSVACGACGKPILL